MGSDRTAADRTASDRTTSDAASGRAAAADDTAADPRLLLPLRQRIVERSLGVRAIHVHRPGRPDVTHRFVDDTPESVFSVSKTVTALGVGIARAEGLLDLEDRVADLLPAPEGGFGREVGEIRVRHLLTMTSGSPVTVFTDPERDHPDPSALFLGTDLVHDPGTRFEYSNGGVLLLSRILQERSGETLRDYLLPRLFAPLGIVNPQWHTTRAGTTWGATALHLRSGQMARIGEVLLGRGTVDGTELVPAEWIDALHAEDTWVATGDAEPESARYGYGVWQCTPEGAWRADGAYGQFLLVLPEQQAMVAITSHLEGRGGAEILRAVWEDLLPLL